MPPLLTPTIGAILLGAGAFGGALAAGMSRRSRQSAQETTLAAVEVSTTILLGALAARLFILTLLGVQPFGEKGIAAIGWAFLFWPGVIDTFGWLATNRTVFAGHDLVDWATVFGGLAGWWDGLRRIHDWRRFGGLPFLLDVTWGGAGTSIGVAAHFLNLGWGRPLDSRRLNAHRYDSGVCTSRIYAITLGNVCGNFQGRGDGPLFAHEATHVLQNRIFGPIYLFTYLFWMAVMLAPAFLWGARVRRPGEVIYAWCYANNPWEEWAYRIGGSRPGHLVWPTRRILIVSAPVACLAILALIAMMTG